MSEIGATEVSLCYNGDDLAPDIVTAALGRPPTHSSTKGEPMVRRDGRVIRTSAGTPVIARAGVWIYKVERREPGDIDGQIQKLFGALTDDLSVWRSLASVYRPDLFVGIFMKEWNEGIVIGHHALEILAARGVDLSLDIYGERMPDDLAEAMGVTRD